MDTGTEFNPFKSESISYDKRLIMESPNPLEKLVDDYLAVDSCGKKATLRKTAVNNLLLNILVAEKNNKVLALPLGSCNYANGSFYGMDHYSYKIIKGLVDELKEAGFIDYKKGFFNKQTNKGMMSRVWATENLLATINQYANVPFQYIDESEEPCRINFLFGQKLNRVRFTKPIILKDENKRLIPYKLDNKILKMQKNINQYNALINQHTITIPKATLTNSTSNSSPILVELNGKSLGYIELDCNLFRVFNDGKFTFGGRFYGAEYQSLNECQRTQILIDGEETCEVDYSACHIRMLYHKEGLDCEGDPYKMVSSDPGMRIYIKKMMQMLINAKSRGKAIGAYREFVDDSKNCETEKSELKSNVNVLINLIMDKHKPIAKYFFTGIGKRLQYKDSQIAENILMHFVRKGIVCLCIHDSFIVKKEFKDELIDVMKRKYKRVIGFECELKIK